MAYDPREKDLADGLFHERAGKTTRVVADLAARDAIALVDRYDGILVQVLETRKLYSWDATNATWVTVTGGSGIAKFATLADLQAATGMTDGDYATVLDTDKLYRYTNTAWVEFSGGGGGEGGGIAKYATMADIYAIAAPSEGDFALALDTGMTMQYRDGAWVSAFNALVDPTAQSGWVLTTEFRSNAELLSGKNIDVSGCEKFRIEVDYPGAGITGHLNATFSNDTAANYACEVFYGQGAAVGAGLTKLTGFRLVHAYAQGSYVMEFNKRTKVGTWRGVARNTGDTGQIVSNDGFVYLGSASMDTIVVDPTTYTYTGTIRVYKWVDGVRPVELHSYELVKQYKLVNKVLNDTLAWDGELDDHMHVVSDSPVAGTPSWIWLQFNGDTTASNYRGQNMYGSGSSASGYLEASIAGGLYVGHCGDGRVTISDVLLARNQGNRKAFISQGGINVAQLVSTQWVNTTAAVASIRIHSGGVSVTGVINVYKKVRTILASTNPNILTAPVGYVDANTVKVQPGEIEINGAVCRVTKAKDVTLSGNLKSGLTEAANTVYYMYAVRRESGNALSYVFDTVAPLMDRYGNLVASFEDCGADRAWFHPTLGTGVRWIGQVLNDASSNILAFTKCMPGYWEGAYTTIPVPGVASLPHAYGKAAFRPRVLFKSAIGDAAESEVIPYFYNAGPGVGAMIASYGSAAQRKTTTSLSANLASTCMYNGTTASASGYYKLVLTEK